MSFLPCVSYQVVYRAAPVPLQNKDRVVYKAIPKVTKAHICLLQIENANERGKAFGS